VCGYFFRFASRTFARCAGEVRELNIKIGKIVILNRLAIAKRLIAAGPQRVDCVAI
jgi:hypothetical protein